MNALWISDAHLSDPASPSYTALLNLLHPSMMQVDAVVLLGDFLDLWIGDNRFLISLHRPLLDLFTALRSRGTSIYYLKGNHDFILGKTWEKDIGARIFEEEAVFNWDGYRFFASHGENIYKKDYGYQAIRKLLRSSLLERSIHLLGDESVYRLSLRFAEASKGKPNEKKQLEQQASFVRYAKDKIENGCHAVILGHTHVMQWQVFSVDHALRLYINPGSWAEKRTFLWYESGRFQVRQFRDPGEEILFDFGFSVE
jgi:UDP-2,3-diacylglucosamine hydrolase